jgi:hypothetical protein
VKIVISNPENKLAVADDGWKWDGNPSFEMIAKMLRKKGILPISFGRGLSFSMGEKSEFKIEANVYPSGSVIGISDLNRFKLSDFLASRECVMIQAYRGSSDMFGGKFDTFGPSLYGPMDLDQTRLAKTFFGLLIDMFGVLQLGPGGSDALKKLIGFGQEVVGGKLLLE